MIECIRILKLNFMLSLKNWSTFFPNEVAKEKNDSTVELRKKTSQEFLFVDFKKLLTQRVEHIILRKFKDRSA